MNTIGSDYIPQESDLMSENGALLRVPIEFLFFQDLNDLPKVVPVIFFYLAINKDIIKVDTTNLSMKALKTWFINLMNVLGALNKPKGMTNHSYKPALVLNVVFHSSPFLILI